MHTTSATPSPGSAWRGVECHPRAARRGSCGPAVQPGPAPSAGGHVLRVVRGGGAGAISSRRQDNGPVRKTRRTSRVGESIRDALVEVFRFDLKDVSLGLASVTEVEVSPDLHFARVYV